MHAPVAAEQQRATLKRDMRVGDSLSFDNGRVVVTLEHKSGQSARVAIRVDGQVKIDKPHKDTPR